MENDPRHHCIRLGLIRWQIHQLPIIADLQTEIPELLQQYNLIIKERSYPSLSS